ncbi:hypothetical protein Pla52n_47470 [Stieleria varia]|uniref:Uncharacterized protein n=1 Tax=Stieleria varia TaxID=2528005 RepID=A0A5C6AFP0_9BACT|nr:hypothetical protein Pla52n_47470 [Stieleria varia]
MFSWRDTPEATSVPITTLDARNGISFHEKPRELPLFSFFSMLRRGKSAVFCNSPIRQAMNKLSKVCNSCHCRSGRTMTTMVDF